jgi:S1-C subfamily serine protease
VRSRLEGPAIEEKSNQTETRRSLKARLRALPRRHERLFLISLGAFGALVAVVLYAVLTPNPQNITQEDIDAAVLHTLENLPEEPSVPRAAYDVVRESVVRVSRQDDEIDAEESGVGTGVVIVEDGLVLTSLHVVAGAEGITVTFADGFQTPATMISAEPEKDLAVLRVEVIPEGLVPATLASSQGLEPGDDVIAVGNPFGIGSSVSAGVVSGLGRSYISRMTGRPIANLIQFDAAVNPGNSGGPLVNRRGEVVGIVISLLNPTEDGVFIGIGFAVPIETAAALAGPSPF